MARRVAAALENGTNDEEISRLQREVKENGNKMAPGVKKGVENMLKELRGQSNDVIDLLEGLSSLSESVGTLSNECASFKKQLNTQAKQISNINGRSR